MRLFYLAVMALCVSGCFNDRSSLTGYDQSTRMNPNLANNYQESQSPAEEYVNRVAKRIMIVSNRPANKYTFVVDNEHNPFLNLDPETKTVTISAGALRQLNDEAELAATLTMSMGRLDNTPNIDKATINALFMAGYDPHAMLELQEQYIYDNNHGEHWMQALFPVQPSASQIADTKNLVEKMPSGLQRGAENYKQLING